MLNTQKENRNYRWLSRSILAVYLLLISQFSLYSQAREVGYESSKTKKSEASSKAGFDPSKLIVGGNIGLQFGNITLIEASPRIGYMLRPNLQLGLSGRYIYYEEKTIFGTFKNNIFGGGIFSQYYFLENFIAHVEYEVLNLDDYKPPFERTNIQSVFVGGGYRSMVSDRAFFNLLLLYNLNETYNSPYTNPIIRIGFGLGL